MLTLFFEHYTIKSARRALIICSFLTLLLPGVQIEGNGLNFFGLLFVIQKQTMLTTMQIISAYFLWVFVWLNVVNISNSANARVSKYLETRLKVEYEIAEKIDHEYVEGERDHFEADLEPWWEKYNRLKTVTEFWKKVFTTLTSATAISGIYAIEYFPPLIAGVCAVFLPDQTHNWIFTLFVSA